MQNTDETGEIDYLESARRVARCFLRRSSGAALRHDPEEVYAAALYAIGELATKYISELGGSWGGYISRFGHWALVDELRRSGYMYRANNERYTKRPKMYCWDGGDAGDGGEIGFTHPDGEVGCAAIDMVDLLEWIVSELTYMEKHILTEYYSLDIEMQDIQKELGLDFHTTWTAKEVALAKIRLKIADDIRENSPFDLDEALITKSKRLIELHFKKQAPTRRGSQADITNTRGKFIRFIRANPGCTAREAAEGILHHYNDNAKAARFLASLVNRHLVPVEWGKAAKTKSPRTLYPSRKMAYGPHILGGPINWRAKTTPKIKQKPDRGFGLGGAIAILLCCQALRRHRHTTNVGL